MDFFAQQDSARRRTTLLVFYFAVAVVLIVATLNLVAAAGAGWLEKEAAERLYRTGNASIHFVWRLDLALWTTGLTLLVIGGGTFYRWLSLRSGGRAVAELAGGREVAPGTPDPDARRLLNIVEEMSLASGVPMPSVFILEDEPGLNAFAAGFTPSDAAIAVTRGAIEKLTRDELQGVVAHEFSHILNGDMRLNIRLVGVLFGILMLAMIGRGLLQSLRFTGASRSRREKGGGGIVVLIVAALALLAIGYIGYFFGRLIQAAVSRQREFLADAAAVQFTRNPAGIGGALKKIGAYAIGSGIVSTQATQIRHFFFAQAFTGGMDFFATHPPLDQRIRAVDPQWDGNFPAVAPHRPRVHADAAAEMAAAAPDIARAVLSQWRPGEIQPRQSLAPVAPPPISAAVLLASIGSPSASHLDRARALLAALPPRLAEAARNPAEVAPALFSLLLGADESVRTRQNEIIRTRHGVACADMLATLAPLASLLPAEQRQPVLNLSLPALRSLPAGDAEGLVETAHLLIAADGEVSLFEFMVTKALDRHVAAPARVVRPGIINFHSFVPLAGEVALVLSTLSRLGADSPDEATRAFALASARIPPLAGRLLLLPTQACTLESIGLALDKLVEASPAIRKILLGACTEAVTADGVVEPEEAELLRAIADALDCPIPPMLTGKASD